jgi:hypothetical protein
VKIRRATMVQALARRRSLIYHLRSRVNPQARVPVGDERFRTRILLLLLPLALLTVACAAYEPPKGSVRSPGRETGMRQDCNAILGTAFHSLEERGWFEQNCSRWPAAVLAIVPPAPQGGQPAALGVQQIVANDSPDCAAVRGKPYSSEAQRQWFLTNCLRPDPPSAPTPATRPVPSPTVAPRATNGPLCEALRRSPNPSDAERRWYFTNCDVR